MIRHSYIKNQVLKLYTSLPEINFPFDVKLAIRAIPNCRYLSYQKFAQINNCSIDDVIRMCKSKAGCSYYDIANDRYLILCNQSSDINLGRQRWTCGHEIGHIMCNHHKLPTPSESSMCNINTLSPLECESEADLFSSILLAPFPLFNILEISSVLDAQNTFGLSTEAALYRYKSYLKWKSAKIKTAWDNDLINIYKCKNHLS